VNAFTHGNIVYAVGAIADAERDVEEGRREAGRLGKEPPYAFTVLEINLRHAREALQKALALEALTEADE